MSKAKEPHSEERWAIKYTRDSDGESYFGGFLTHSRYQLPNMEGTGLKIEKVRVLVTEIKPKRKAKR